MRGELKPGVRLQGDFWPEPVRVLTVTPAGTLIRLEAVGEKSGRFYGERWLSQEELSTLKVSSPQALTFSGNGEAAFLALEARRIGLAHQFDPLQAVHVSQVDPLPRGKRRPKPHPPPHPQPGLRAPGRTAGGGGPLRDTRLETPNQ